MAAKAWPRCRYRSDWREARDDHGSRCLARKMRRMASCAQRPAPPRLAAGNATPTGRALSRLWRRRQRSDRSGAALAARLCPRRLSSRPMRPSACPGAGFQWFPIARTRSASDAQGRRRRRRPALEAFVQAELDAAVADAGPPGAGRFQPRHDDGAASGPRAQARRHRRLFRTADRRPPRPDSAAAGAAGSRRRRHRHPGGRRFT